MIFDFTNSDVRKTNNTILNDSFYGGLLIDSIEGKSEQNGTPNPNAPVEIKRVVGKNLTDNKTVGLMHKLPVSLKAGTYTISFKTTGTNGGFRLSNTTSTSTNSVGVSGKVNADGYVIVTLTTDFVSNYINTSSDGTASEFMLVEGATALPYVPYGNLEVKTGGNQILNYDKWKTVGATYGTAVFENNGVTLTATSQDAYTNYNANVFPKIPVKEGETVTLSWEQDRNDILGMICIFGEGTASKMTSVDCRTANSLSYVVPSGVTFITFRFGVYSTGNTISFKNIMLNRGDVALPYEPYQCSTVNFTANLHGINNIKDRIIKKDGLWQIERRLGNVVFDGSSDESWTYAATNNSSKYRYQTKLLIGNIKNGVIAEVSNILSSHYVATTSNTSGTYGCNTGISVNSDGSIYIFNSNVCSNNVTAWCEWLQSNPVTVVYELNEPEYITLPPMDQSAINSLLTYNSVTYVSTDSAVVPVINSVYGISAVGGYALLGATSGEAAKLGSLQVVSFDSETGVLITKSEVQL